MTRPTQVRNLIFIGLVTWAIVAVPQTWWMAEQGQLFTPGGWLFLGCMIAFLACFALGTRETCEGTLELSLIAGESISALVCVALQPHKYVPVLLVIVAGQLGHVTPRIAWGWLVAQNIVLAIVIGPADGGWIMTLAYATFQLFSFFTATIAYQEREAKQALAEANAELRVTTGLLDMSSRAAERLRIARDLHDLIGHHLTALSLNLEVASHLANGEARGHIEKSQALTKLLLADVRDVVSRLRENEPLDLAASLRSLGDVVKSPAIQIDVNELAVTNPAIAETALRAAQEIVTNAVRHSSARNLWLRVTNVDHTLAIDARDDGIGTDRVLFGNGLTGMRERVAHAGGTLEVQSMRGRGFEVHIRLPLESAT